MASRRKEEDEDNIFYKNKGIVFNSDDGLSHAYTLTDTNIKFFPEHYTYEYEFNYEVTVTQIEKNKSIRIANGGNFGYKVMVQITSLGTFKGSVKRTFESQSDAQYNKDWLLRFAIDEGCCASIKVTNFVIRQLPLSASQLEAILNNADNWRSGQYANNGDCQYKASNERVCLIEKYHYIRPNDLTFKNSLGTFYLRCMQNRTYTKTVSRNTIYPSDVTGVDLFTIEIAKGDYTSEMILNAISDGSVTFTVS